MHMRFLKNVSLLTLFFISCPVWAFAGPLPDHLHAEVAVQLKENGQLTKEVHRLKLVCFEGECWLDTQVINRCDTVNGKSFQSPFSFVIRSSDNNSKFQVRGNVVDITKESFDFGGKSLSTYRFVLSTNREGSPSILDEVLDFSGGYMKDSDIVKRLIKVEFIPLRGKYVKIDLACPIEFPGIASSGR